MSSKMPKYGVEVVKTFEIDAADPQYARNKAYHHMEGHGAEGVTEIGLTSYRSWLVEEEEDDDGV